MSANSKAEANQSVYCESGRLTQIELKLINVFRQLKTEHKSDVLRFLSALLAAQ